MITSRRDYILRLIDEVGRLLARAIFKRGTGAGQEALQTIVQACEQLFALEADKLFQFTPDQHFVMLTEGEEPTVARDKVLLYAALNREAAAAYTQLGNREMARATTLNALRFTLRARAELSSDNLPAFTPDIAGMLDQLGNAPLDPETEALFRAATGMSVAELNRKIGPA